MFGIVAGGLPVEGNLYGEALGYVFQGLLGLYTAGYTDETKFGPQINFINSAYWSNSIGAYLHNSTPTPKLPNDPAD